MPTILTIKFEPNIPSRYLFTWGSNSAYAVGQGTDSGTTATPTQVETASNWNFVSQSNASTMVIATDGTLWAVGNNPNGALGIGSTNPATVLTQESSNSVDWAQSTDLVQKLAHRIGHTVAIKTNGTMWGAGVNSVGQLSGAGGNTFSQIGSDTNWEQVASAGSSTAAIKTDGTLWTTGSNFGGLTGQGTTVGNTTSFTQVGSDTDWAFVTGGQSHYFAIKNNGTLWAWGQGAATATNRDPLGLGRNSASDITTPTQVGSATWSHISAGAQFSVGIQTDGTLWSTGNNASGERGLTGGTSNNSNTFGLVNSDTDWQYVACNDVVTRAIKGAGQLWTFGRNLSDSLGRAGASTPTQIGSDDDWLSVGSVDGNSRIGAALKSTP